jgi:hypothetical protein
MNIDQASNFLGGSILVGLGCIVLVATAAAINNILSRYWRPVNLSNVLPRSLTDMPSRFATEEELAQLAAQFDNSNETKVKSK